MTKDGIRRISSPPSPRRTLSRLSRQLSSLSEFLNLVPLTPPPFTRTLEQAMYINPVVTCVVRRSSISQVYSVHTAEDRNYPFNSHQAPSSLINLRCVQRHRFSSSLIDTPRPTKFQIGSPLTVFITRGTRILPVCGFLFAVVRYSGVVWRMADVWILPRASNIRGLLSSYWVDHRCGGEEFSR
jgi:hypothetical protein